MHLFMITTSWNEIGINIGDLFLFLEFDPEGENDTLPLPPSPTREAIYARGHQNISFLIFIYPKYLKAYVPLNVLARPVACACVTGAL